MKKCQDNIIVTVICITYNQEEYIKDALEGIVNQKTNFKYEVIVHDDASTDFTSDIIKEYVKKYPTIIKPIYQKINQYQQGINIMTNLYKIARGKYIAICEGDDYWIDENKLQYQVNYFEKHKDCTFLFHNATVIDESTGKKKIFVPYGNEAKRNMKKDGRYNVAEIEMLGFIPTASFMFRKKFISKLPNWFEKAFVGDWPLKLVMTSFGYAYFDNRVMCVYRKNANGSVTVANKKKEKINIKNAREILNKKNEILYNIDEFTNYKYHTVFEKQQILNKIEFLFQIKKEKEIISKGYLEKFNILKKIKLIIRIFLPYLYKKLKR